MNDSPTKVARCWHFVGALALAAFSVGSLRGQESWSAVASPTAQALRGLCYGAGQFVAVGDGGTVLASPDGFSWTARAGGTTRSLTAIAYSPERKLFVAVGETGTILTAGDGATSWTVRASGTSVRLSNVAFGSGVFLAVGDNGTAVTSPDGLVWTLRPTGGSVALRGLAFGNGVFVVGHDLTEYGGILVTADGGVTFRKTSFADFNSSVRTAAIAWGGDGFYVTDTNRVMRGSADGATWDTDRDLVDNGNKVYGLAFFHETLLAVGGRGLIRDRFGNPHFGGVTDTDWHAIAAGSDQAVIVGTGGLIAIQHSVAASSVGLVDTTFRPNLNAPPQTVVPLADGRVYVAGTALVFTNSGSTQRYLARLNRDGSLDTAFAPNLDLDGDHPTRLLLLAQPDGRVVIIGVTYRIAAGPGGYYSRPFYKPLARLNPNGSTDTRFQPGPMSERGALPILLADGTWLVVSPSWDSSLRKIVMLTKFTSDGARDDSFAPATLTSPVPDVQMYPTADVVSAIDARNRIYIAASYRPLFLGPTNSLLFRLNPDGTPDSSFTVRTFDELSTLLATDRGLIIQRSKVSSTAYVVTTARLTLDADVDATFRPLTTDLTALAQEPNGFRTPLVSKYGYTRLSATADGAFFALTHVQHGRHGIVRFRPDGTFDADVSADLALDSAAIDSLVPLANGQILVAGSFSSIEGVPQSYLARLTPNRHAATTRLRNLSVRAQAGQGASTLIAGFITTGGQTTTLIRGAGPALATFGVSDTLPDPQLGVFAGPAPIAGNDDWGVGPAAATVAMAATQVRAFSFATESKDAALLQTAPAGAYTIQLTGKNSATGTALIELYDTEATPSDSRSPRLANLAARANAGAGGSTLIVGFVIEGDNTRNILIRAVGPGLGRFGVPGTLVDPILTLFRGTTPIAINDDWGGSYLADGLRSKEAAAAVRAFPLDAASKDSAFVVTLTPGAYTALISGAGGASGVVLVEVYDLP